MRFIIIAVLSAFMVLPAGAISMRKACRQACGALTAACAQRTTAAGFGDLAKACKAAVQKRCVSEGPAVCATFCGNGSRDGQEACDGGGLSGASCASLGFASGNLACSALCGFDTSGCEPFAPPTCGNGAIDTPEQCDGTMLGGATCASLGFTLGGTLACTAGCAFDTRLCQPSALPACGNGVIDGPEQCDGEALGEATCANLGFTLGGTLACTPGCAFDTRGCRPAPQSTCGNGVVDGLEQCDGAALGGATCASLGFTLGGTLACTAGCGFETSGCATQRFPKTGQTVAYRAHKNEGGASAVRVPDDGTIEAGQALTYVDHGDGTITDMATGLMWEKKSDDGGLHDQDNAYLWSGDGTQETIWDWLEDVNAEAGTGFAGHRDWRIPNVRELQSLVSYGAVNPTVDPAFDSGCTEGCPGSTCSCTFASGYWSSSTDASLAARAWFVSFVSGSVSPAAKTGDFKVRAVRSIAGGSQSCGVSDKCIFVTNGVSTGSLNGIGGADSTCRTIAASAGLHGTYLAWLSDGRSDAFGRVHSDGPYVTPAGDLVASSLVDLTDGTLDTPIDKNEYGTPVPTREVWTGTSPEGEGTGIHCSHWTTDAQDATGHVGLNTSTSQDWTATFPQFCDRNVSLYCIQQ